MGPKSKPYNVDPNPILRPVCKSYDQHTAVLALIPSARHIRNDEATAKTDPFARASVKSVKEGLKIGEVCLVLFDRGALAMLTSIGA